MSKWKKFLYSVPIWHSNEQRFHLDNGYILDFKTMKIEVENNDVYTIGDSPVLSTDDIDGDELLKEVKVIVDAYYGS